MSEPEGSQMAFWEGEIPAMDTSWNRHLEVFAEDNQREGHQLNMNEDEFESDHQEMTCQHGTHSQKDAESMCIWLLHNETHLSSDFLLEQAFACKEQEQ